ncbi:MAG: KEOPS complex subunit Cgi121 [Methanomethylovorans sp.]|uniref:KEOPS complex subunit Cgi121 n=1 Tax=Methanomethylovorans sp. TaxID=2758717 RepID=UPI000A5A1F2D|nr:KEOPS complex subunit Cgi121 [Methanomethylovorans sp.]
MHIEFVSGRIFIEDLKSFLRSLEDISKATDCIVQSMNADKVAGKDHLRFAVAKAIRAFEQERNVAKDVGIEIMRYASGKRQIEEAFSMGVKQGQNNVVFIVMGKARSVTSCVDMLKQIVVPEDVITYLPSKRDEVIMHFSITADEIEVVGEQMVPELVIERVALVDVLK